MMTTQETHDALAIIAKHNARIGSRHILAATRTRERLPVGVREYHEAGHAVVAHLLGGVVRTIDCREDNPNCDLNLPGTIDDVARAAVAAAGAVGEEMHGLPPGVMGQRYPRHGAHADVALAFNGQPVAGFSTDEWHRGCEQAADLLHDHLPLFFDVVQALLLDPVMDRDAFLEIAKRHRV